MVAARCAEVEVVERISADRVKPIEPAGRITSSNLTGHSEELRGPEYGSYPSRARLAFISRRVAVLGGAESPSQVACVRLLGTRAFGELAAESAESAEARGRVLMFVTKGSLE